MLSLKTFVASCLVFTLAACGGGGGKSGSSPFSPVVTDPPGSSTQALTLSVTLLDSNSNPTSALVGSNTLRVQAVLRKEGVAQPDQLVQFSVLQAGNYATLDQLSYLTNSVGAAVVTLRPGTVSGAGQVKVVATLVDGSTVEGAANFLATPTAQSSATLSLNPPIQVDSTTVSAYGTMGFSVTVTEGTSVPSQPVTVTFASDCQAGKAIVTSSAQTNPSGVAIGTFEDVGCASAVAKTVTLTAAISGSSITRAFTVNPSTVGSLRFVSVNPSDASITLRGNGGSGRQENAQLTFKLVDQAGNGVANADVCFDSTTYIGGLTLDGFNDLALPTNPGTTALCGNDAMAKVRYVKRTDSAGNVSVQVASGSVPTPVRLRARALFPSTATLALETFSDSLSISTGLPLQRSFSLSVDKANIDGGNGTAGGREDGDEATLTVRLADQFSNPVPDGTIVTFVASGGSVCTSQKGACSTTNGVCSCKFVGQNRRPQDGRVVVMAYAVGLEDYTDVNGDNVYSFAGDANNYQDLGDAFVDANKSGGYSGVSVNGDTDIPVPFQGTVFNASGDLQRATAHIRASTVIYLGAPSGKGDPTVVLPNASLSLSTNLLTGDDSDRFILMDPFGGCPDAVPSFSFQAILDDGYGNPMAAGTSLSAADFTDNLASKSVRPSAVLALGARVPSPSIDGPLNGGGGNVIKVTPWAPAADRGNVTTAHVLTIQGVKEKCGGNAGFVLDVSSPKGSAAQAARVLYEGEPRTTDRFGFDVRYLDAVQLSVVDSSVSVSESVVLSNVSFNRLQSIGVQSYSLNWGDGSTLQTGTTLPITTQTHAYTTAGTYTVRLRVIGTNSVTYEDTLTVSVSP